MTQEEIQERNNQIALMLGYANTTPTDKDFNIYENTSKPFRAIPKMIETMSMQFHLDWNWLMEAVEFIESIEVDDFGYIVEMLPSSSRIYLAKNNLSIISIGPKSSRKEAVFIAVSDFAKLYNNKEL